MGHIPHVLRRVLTAIVAVAVLACAAGPLAAAETRCGWLQNPTPANWRLDDRDGSWTIMSQGAGDEPPGMDLIPDLSGREFVRTNGNYGYACACLAVETDARGRRITRILSAKQRPLVACRKDRALPRP